MNQSRYLLRSNLIMTVRFTGCKKSEELDQYLTGIQAAIFGTSTVQAHSMSFIEHLIKQITDIVFQILDRNSYIRSFLKMHPTFEKIRSFSIHRPNK